MESACRGMGWDGMNGFGWDGMGWDGWIGMGRDGVHIHMGMGWDGGIDTRIQRAALMGWVGGGRFPSGGSLWLLIYWHFFFLILSLCLGLFMLALSPCFLVSTLDGGWVGSAGVLLHFGLLCRSFAGRAVMARPSSHL